jgi:hypothetical protein
MSSSLQYPTNADEIESWNAYISNLSTLCSGLLLDYNDQRERCDSFFKVFNTLQLDNIKPSVFIDHYIKAIGKEQQNNQNISAFVRRMTLMFLGHSTSHELSEGQAVRSARSQTVARLLTLAYEEHAIKNGGMQWAKRYTKKETKDLRI